MLSPGRRSEVDGTLLPVVGFVAGNVAGEFLACHHRKLLAFVDELIGGSAVGRDNATKRADFTDVENKSARIQVPDNGNFVAIQIKLRAFTGAPVGSDLRKFTNDQRFDVRTAGFLVVQIGADVADVRIGETNDLARVTGIGENFLVTGEAGIKNDFAAAAGDSSGRAAMKDAPIFEREYGGSVLNVRQWILPFEWVSYGGLR